MKSIKYLNSVLTVIAVCLVILTISVIGAFPEASANANDKKNIKPPFEKNIAADTVVQVVKGDLIKARNSRSETIYISKSKIMTVSGYAPKLQVVLIGGSALEINENITTFVERVNK
jgi:hypothetical protein